MYRILTELTIVVHLAFILFVIAGGMLVWRWPWVSVPHLAAVAWAVYTETAPGIVCPLTDLENYFAGRAALASYQDDFITHYLAPIIYPDSLTPKKLYLLTAFVIVLNLLIYSSILWKKSKGRRKAHQGNTH